MAGFDVTLLGVDGYLEGQVESTTIAKDSDVSVTWPAPTYADSVHVAITDNLLQTSCFFAPSAEQATIPAAALTLFESGTSATLSIIAEAATTTLTADDELRIGVRSDYPQITVTFD